MDDPLYLSHNSLKIGFLGLFLAARSMEELLRPVLCECGLSAPHFRIMLCLSHYQPISKKTLQTKLSIHKQTLHDHNQLLFEKNYIRCLSDRQDKRVHLLELTEQGEQTLRKAFALCAPMMQETFRLCGQQAVDGYKRVTQRLGNL